MDVINNIKNEESSDFEGWGFYIDIENQNPIISNNYEKMREKYKLAKLSDVFTENCDEYDYYVDNYNYNVEFDYKNNNISKRSFKGLIIKVSSTTIITVALTYIVFCVL
jgi:hypothetical protein